MIRSTLHLLGPIRLTYDMGTPPRFRSQRTVALLAYLCAEQRPFARDTLVTLFWPDEPEVAARANLRRELNNLRQLLPSCWEINHISVAFTPHSDIVVDLDLFRSLASSGD